MDLKQYDGQCVRVTDLAGEVFEAICDYNHEEYCEHEFGRYEDALQLVNFLFYNSDIQTVKSLEAHNGPYGRFSASFGRIEELNTEEGIDCIYEQLFCEEDEHVSRLLTYLSEYLQTHTPDWLGELCDYLHQMLQFRVCEPCRPKLEQLLAQIEQIEKNQ